mmetsp:Transcript_52068/g.122220  ORF Transcript_52068/g.122220 Transcript_52068/m.122220 type:complete len:502 (+) Transcript_52068:49-1554(+)
MVHLVSERPRESVFPILLQHCSGQRKGKNSLARNSFWRIAFPLYYVLLSLTSNLLFLVGSFLFLPIKERELTVSFTFVVEGVDVNEVMTSNISLFQQLERNFTGLLASDKSSRIKPHHSNLQWRKTTSCSLDNAMLFDVNIYPREGYSASALERSLPPVSSIKEALNGSLTAIGIDRLATGEIEVNVVSRPRLVESAIVQKWAVDLGCNLFIIGSALLAFISGMDIFEDVLLCGLKLPGTGTATRTTTSTHYEWLGSDAEAADSDFHVMIGPRSEKLLYLSGGLVFLVGTMYFQHPQMLTQRLPSEVVAEEDVLFLAIWMFILGSIIFVFATFLNALTLNASGRTFIHWSVATCGIYELGGILFVMGSVCFMPNQGCKEGMEILGAWCFILGAACYVLGDFIDFMKTSALIFLRLRQEEAARRIERAMLAFLFRRRLEQAGIPLCSNPSQSPPTLSRGLSRARSGSVTQAGLVTTFRQAMLQRTIIQALQLRDVPDFRCEV